MIDLPTDPAPNGVMPSLLDFGVVQRSPTGAATARYDRKGARFALEISFPPMEPAISRIFVSRLLAAKNEGLRIEYPLIDVNQGSPGAPLVNGAGQAGRTLAIKGLTPGYQFREGFWLHIQDAAGRRYLHNCRTEPVATAGGLATIGIEPALRVPFANNAVIAIAAPTVEGLVTSVASWDIPLHKKVAVSFTLEEYA